MKNIARVAAGATLLGLVLAATSARAELSPEELAKLAQNPVGNLISLPFQNNTNFDFGPLEKTQNVLNIQPVYPIHVNADWNVITRTIMPLLWQPALYPGQGSTFGLSDVQFSAFLSPASPGDWIWGAGAIAQLPTNTDDVLGNDNWGLGPTAVLLHMQREHFWYRGRHQLLLNVLRQEISTISGEGQSLHAIDLGGGGGGWIEYLEHHVPGMFQTLALGDSSIHALTLAKPVVGAFADRYQIDLLDLTWHEEWDVIFLLDVLEHIPDHVEVLQQIRNTMKPGGLLFITTPALNFFWTHNDDLARHQRRYSKADFRQLAGKANLKFVRADYFMFFLSPALMFYRMMVRPHKTATPEELQEYLWRSHQVPGKLVNSILTRIFLAQAALVNHIALPWGTSILAVFQR